MESSVFKEALLDMDDSIKIVQFDEIWHFLLQKSEIILCIIENDYTCVNKYIWKV